MDYRYENKTVYDHYCYSILAASYRNAGGNHERGLRKWLEHLRDEGAFPNLTESDIYGVMRIGWDGRLELEEDAKKFIKSTNCDVKRTK